MASSSSCATRLVRAAGANVGLDQVECVWPRVVRAGSSRFDSRLAIATSGHPLPSASRQRELRSSARIGAAPGVVQDATSLRLFEAVHGAGGAPRSGPATESRPTLVSCPLSSPSWIASTSAYVSVVPWTDDGSGRRCDQEAHRPPRPRFRARVHYPPPLRSAHTIRRRSLSHHTQSPARHECARLSRLRSRPRSRLDGFQDWRPRAVASWRPSSRPRQHRSADRPCTPAASQRRGKLTFYRRRIEPEDRAPLASSYAALVDSNQATASASSHNVRPRDGAPPDSGDRLCCRTDADDLVMSRMGRAHRHRREGGLMRLIGGTRRPRRLACRQQPPRPKVRFRRELGRAPPGRCGRREAAALRRRRRVTSSSAAATSSSGSTRDARRCQARRELCSWGSAAASRRERRDAALAMRTGRRGSHQRMAELEPRLDDPHESRVCGGAQRRQRRGATDHVEPPQVVRRRRSGAPGASPREAPLTRVATSARRAPGSAPGRRFRSSPSRPARASPADSRRSSPRSAAPARARSAAGIPRASPQPTAQPVEVQRREARRGQSRLRSSVRRSTSTATASASSAAART